MAPESERAKGRAEQFYDAWASRYAERPIGERFVVPHSYEAMFRLMDEYAASLTPTAAPASCSEVVERLAAIFDNLWAGACHTYSTTGQAYNEGRADAYKNAAENMRTNGKAILHSWRRAPGTGTRGTAG